MRPRPPPAEGQAGDGGGDDQQRGDGEDGVVGDGRATAHRLVLDIALDAFVQEAPKSVAACVPILACPGQQPAAARVAACSQGRFTLPGVHARPRSALDLDRRRRHHQPPIPHPQGPLVVLRHRRAVRDGDDARSPGSRSFSSAVEPRLRLRVEAGGRLVEEQPVGFQPAGRAPAPPAAARRRTAAAPSSPPRPAAGRTAAGRHPPAPRRSPSSVNVAGRVRIGDHVRSEPSGMIGPLRQEQAAFPRRRCTRPRPNGQMPAMARNSVDLAAAGAAGDHDRFAWLDAPASASSSSFGAVGQRERRGPAPAPRRSGRASMPRRRSPNAARAATIARWKVVSRSTWPAIAARSA